MSMAHGPNLAAIDLNLLVALRALLNERHVTRAARLLGVSQSAASHALSRLRELYGDPLLVRAASGLTLTSRATALLPQLERGLRDLEGSLVGQERFEPGRARLTMRVGAADHPQALFCSRLLAILRAEAPGVRLKMTSHADLVEPLDAGVIDVAITMKGKPPRGFAERPLVSDSFVCMVRRGHPILRQGRLTVPRYLALEHLLVVPKAGADSVVDTELSRRNLVRSIALQVSTFLVVPQMVMESDLISTGPALLLGRLSALHPVVLLRPPLSLPPFDLCLVWHSRREHDPAHAWMRDVITRAAQSLGQEQTLGRGLARHG